MAGGRIKGITIEIDGDTTGLSKALKGVDSSLKDTQAQLKDVNKLLKMDPKNTELLRQKQDLLGKAIEDTKKKLETQKQALEQLASVDNPTEEMQKQQDALRREIIATEGSLKDYTKQLKDMPSKLSQVSEATAKLAEKTKYVSAAAAGMATALIGNAIKSAAAADDLATLSAQTGLTVEELQKMQYASNLVDVSVDDMVGSVKKLTMQMGKGSDVFEKLGVSITDSNGEMRSATDVWYESLEALSQIQNETERDAISMELFGKSAASLTGIIDDGGKAMKELGQEAESLGLVMSGDAVNAAVEFNNQMDLMKQRVSMAFMKMGSALATTLVPAIEKLVNLVTQVVTWFSELDGTTQAVILTVLGLVAAISPVLSMISLVTGAAAALNVAVLPMIGTMALIVAGIAAVVAAGVWLYNNWDMVKEKAAEVWNSVVSFFTQMKDNVVQTFTELVQKGTEFVANLANGIMSGIDLVTSAISSILDGVMSTISGFFTDIYNAGADIISELGSGISSAVSGIYESVKLIGSNIVSGVWQGIQDAKDAFFSNISGFFSGLVDSAKATLGIHSPSKAFEEIGKYSALGYVEGMDKVLGKYNPALSMLQGGKALGNANYNFTNNINLNGQYRERDGYNIALSVDRWLGARV